MKVRALRNFTTKSGPVTAGAVIDVPPELMHKLKGLVEVIRDPEPPKKRHSNPWSRTTTAWLENGELRVQGVVADLAGEIVRLTAGDLVMQRQLLEEHCQAYGPTHIHSLFEAWEERAAIMEYDAGMTRAQAEAEAAKLYHLVAWLPELRRSSTH